MSSLPNPIFLLVTKQIVQTMRHQIAIKYQSVSGMLE